MKLLIILPSTQRGGAEEYTLKIARGVEPKKWTIHTAFPKTPETISLINDFTQQNIEYHQLEIADEPGNKFASLKASLLRLFTTYRLLLKIKPDVVLLNLPAHYFGFAVVLVCGLLKIPTAVVFHLIPAPAMFSSAKLQAYHWAKSRNQKWITISDYNCKYLAQEFDLDINELECVYNGIKQESLVIPSKSDRHELRLKIRQELGLTDNSKLLLTVARLHPQKGHDYLIPIIPEIVARFPPVRFVWVGDGERSSLTQMLRQHNVEAEVSFLGYRRDIPDILNAADIFLFPSYQEGLPFAVLEALVYGLPIVASDTGGIPEMVVHQHNGLLFKTGDRQDLQEKLDWALTHPTAMAQMAEVGKVEVQKFSEKKMLEDTSKILENLALLSRSKTFSK